MTEFVATALLVSLLALCVRPAPDRLRVVLTAAVLAVLVAAIRVQYAPLALLVLGLFFLRTEKKMQLALAAAHGFRRCRRIRRDHVGWWVVSLLLRLYIRVNLALGDLRAGESPAWQFLYWLLINQYGTGSPVYISSPCKTSGATDFDAGAHRPDPPDSLYTVAQGCIVLSSLSFRSGCWLAQTLWCVVRVSR